MDLIIALCQLRSDESSQLGGSGIGNSLEFSCEAYSDCLHNNRPILIDIIGDGLEPIKS